MKIIIYTGSFKNETFIELLINSISKNKEIYLLSNKDNYFDYRKKNIFYGVYFIKNNTILLIIKSIIIFLNLLFSSPELLIRNIKLLSFSFSKKYLKKLNLYNKVSLINPDIIHIQWTAHIEYFKNLIDTNCYKFIVSLRGRHINITPKVDSKTYILYKSYFKKISFFHAVSEHIKLEALKYGVRKNKISVIYSAVDNNTILKSLKLYNKPSNNDFVKIISVGRQHWKKGYNYALDAMRLLMNSDVKFKYTIVGGSNSDELLYQTTDLNLNEHVSLVPRMSHENVLKEIFNSDIFLLPSVEEGIANVVYESMILRTIVVCTDYQGMKEIIKEDETGFLFKSRSPHDIDKGY